MSNIIDFTDRKRSVNHELCTLCHHNEVCTSVCVAIEALVQLCKVKSPMTQLDFICNVGTQLDLENSFTDPDLQGR